MTSHRPTLALAAAAALSSAAFAAPEGPMPDLATLKKMNARFAPVNMEVDIRALPESEKAALRRLVEAAKVMDALFLRQIWAGNEAMLLDLVADGSPLGRERLHAFLLDKGPWSRLDKQAPFVPGAPPKPAGANFYPANATKADVEAWLQTLPDGERARATGFFTTIRRDPAGKFTAVPYSLEYGSELALAAAKLREAAKLTQQPTLAAYLAKRADALLSNDYYASDVAWMELDASIEPTIGPYEVYEDDWFNAKAAFEAFVAVRDDAETAKLARLGAVLQEIENHLPLDEKHKNQKLAPLAPIRVVNSVFSAGDGNRGVQTAAYNLPNDERVAAEKGTKRVMLKNIQEAKFSRVLMPIAKVALAPEDVKKVAFDAFFTHILMHELMHGLGPHTIVVGGKATTVREQLQETYSFVEEAKADISGLFALQYLVDRGAVDKALEKTMYVTFLASTFRSIRFGVTEAHGKGMALQVNYLLDAGAFAVGKGGVFSVDQAKAKAAVAALTRELMTLEAEGNKAQAEDMMRRLVAIRPEVQAVLDKLQGVPVDIAPRFVTAEKLVAGK